MIAVLLVPRAVDYIGSGDEGMSANTSVTLRLDGPMRFVASTRSGHEIAVDASVASGGADSAARPIQMLLVALGGCTGMDVISICRKMRQDVTSYEVSLSGERATEHPRVFTSIAMLHRLRGRGLAAASVARAIQLSMTRYCPVYAMLRGTVAITARYEVTDEDSGATATGAVEPEKDPTAL